MILLDTATLIWMVSETDSLSREALETIEAHSEIAVSSMSAWEIGMLVSKGRITLDRSVDRWIDDAIRAHELTPVPVDHHIGVLATMLPANPPSDPADRMIIATALRLGVPLVTPDRRLLDYPFCPTVW